MRIGANGPLVEDSSLVGENGAHDGSVVAAPGRENAPTDSATDSLSPAASDNDRAQQLTDAAGAKAELAAESQQQPIGDDWYSEGGGRPSNLARRNSGDGSSSAKQQGGGDDFECAWSRTAREITRLWVRAVGSLCCPSHSEHWPQLIDVGILGALNT